MLKNNKLPEYFNVVIVILVVLVLVIDQFQNAICMREQRIDIS